MRLRQAPARLVTDEGGFATLWNIFWCVCFLTLGGLAIDHANAMRIKMALQATADSAALAAVIARNEPAKYESYFNRSSAGKTADQRGLDAAVALSTDIMGTSGNGDVLRSADVRYGTWTRADGFTAGTGDFVEVTTYRATRNDNALQMLLLDAFTPLQSWDVAARAVAQRYRPDCAQDGIITSDIVDVQSRSRFQNSICIYGGLGVELNQNNIFDPGVVVQMPDLNLLVVPGGDTTRNAGLDEALREGPLTPHLAMQTDAIITGLQDVSSEWQPDYISTNAGAAVIDVTESAFNPNAMVRGNVYRITCTGGNNTLNLRGKPNENAALITNIRFARSDNAGGNGGGNGGGNSGGGNSGGSSSGGGNGGGNGGETGGGNANPTIIEEVVIVTNCKISFDRDTVIQNAIIATTETSDMSITGSASVSIGRPDNCLPGGGAQVISAGGMHFAAKMAFHGSQLVSKGPIKLAAQVDGVGGTSIQSLARVDLASNNAVGLCVGAADEVLPLNYYRLVQ